jgi:hypothetical protein
LLSPSARVQELIDLNTKSWKQQLLNQIFTKEEVGAINSLALSGTIHEDVIMWRGTKNGIFSIKSAYHLAMEEDNNKRPECSINPKVSELCGVIWKLAIPNAGKNFMWWAYHNLLPTKRNLLSRKVVKESMCPFCEMEKETVSHII